MVKKSLLQYTKVCQIAKWIQNVPDKIKYIIVFVIFLI